jgi:carbon-monoxide dehydrogenase medium subunit
LALTVLGGAIELDSHRQSRVVNAREFFLSPLRTVRRQNEVVTAIRWPKRVDDERFAFREFALRAGDYAVVAVACKARIAEGVVQDLCVGFAGVADTPILLDVSSAIGERISEGLAEAVSSRTKSFEPTADLHASREYRRQLAGVLTKSALLEVFKPPMDTVS